VSACEWFEILLARVCYLYYSIIAVYISRRVMFVFLACFELLVDFVTAWNCVQFEYFFSKKKFCVGCSHKFVAENVSGKIFHTQHKQSEA